MVQSYHESEIHAPRDDENSLYAPWQESRNFHNCTEDGRDVRRVNRVSFTEEWNDDQSQQQYQRDPIIQNHWQNFLERPVNFEPHDGETCNVFGGMSFHFVAGVPSF